MEPLRLVGYWTTGTPSPYPDPAAFVDGEWNEDERSFMTHYLGRGIVARAYMGYSPCRLCDKRDNGCLQVTDGTYTWPEGLAHYVADHGVRLPTQFVEHAMQAEDAYGEAEVDESWWLGHAP